MGAPLRGGYQDQARNHPARGHSVAAAPTLHDEPGGLPFAQMMVKLAGSTRARDLGQFVRGVRAGEQGAG